jgi:hypothetical protein
MDMLQHGTTMTWPMALKGVLCVFGSWRTDYTTLEDGLFDPEVEVVWVFTEDDIVPPYRGRRQPYINIDGSWPMEQVAAGILARFQRKAAFCGAVSFSEEEIPLANRLNAILSDGRPSSWATRRQIDKFDLYTVLKAAQVPTVRFDVWRTWDELAVLVAQGYRQGDYVLKPANASDSAGVYRSLPGESVQDSFANFQSSCAKATRLGHRLLRSGQMYLIMEYIEWNGAPIEITSDALVRNGRVDLLVVHEKMKTAAYAPFFDQLMVAPPVFQPLAARLPEIQEVTQQVVSALDFQQGAVHLECRLTQERCIPIDCALRPGGGYIPHAIYQLSGIDVRLAHVASHLAVLPEPRGGTGGPGGTCIGALYASLVPTFEIRTRLVSDLEGHPAIFAIAASEEFIAEPQFTADASLSLGVRASTATEALTLFNEITALAEGKSGLLAAAALPAGDHRTGGEIDG